MALLYHVFLVWVGMSIVKHARLIILLWCPSVRQVNPSAWPCLSVHQVCLYLHSFICFFHHTYDKFIPRDIGRTMIQQSKQQGYHLQLQFTVYSINLLLSVIAINPTTIKKLQWLFALLYVTLQWNNKQTNVRTNQADGRTDGHNKKSPVDGQREWFI